MSKEWIDMSDKVVIVTGGSMGIGSHIVEALLKNHAKVVIADMADCDAYDDNENVMYVKCNVTKKEEVEEILSHLNEKDRELFVKHYLEDIDLETIALKSNTKVSNLYNRLSRGRKRIRENMCK